MVTALSCTYASTTPLSQVAALAPKVVGTACESGYGPPSGAAVGRRKCESTEICSASCDISASTTARVASIRPVSTTSWLVNPRWIHGLTSALARSRSRATNPMTGLPPSSDLTASRSQSPALSNPARSAPPHSSGARPAATSASNQADSTATIDASSAASDIRSPARWSPGHNRFVIPGHRRRSRTRSRARPAGGCRSGNRRFRRYRSGFSAARGRASRQPIRVQVAVGQIGAGEHPVQQPARKDCEREEPRSSGRAPGVSVLKL